MKVQGKSINKFVGIGGTKMKMLDLFSGIGGISLAAHWAGVETIAFCEIEPFCQKALNKHWPDVPIFEDIKKLNRQALIDSGVMEDGETIDIICGGYPCQPFSLAGNRRGEKDDRHLWPYVKELLQEIRPYWFVGENVVGHVTLGLDTVLADLESIGYTSQPFIIPACGVGAIHRRERVFIVAHTDSESMERSSIKKIQRKSSLQGKFYYGGPAEWSRRSEIYQPKLSRSFNGIPDQVDRIRALGNAVVPQQIYPIFEAIVKIHEQVGV